MDKENCKHIYTETTEKNKYVCSKCGTVKTLNYDVD